MPREADALGVLRVSGSLDSFVDPVPTLAAADTDFDSAFAVGSTEDKEEEEMTAAVAEEAAALAIGANKATRRDGGATNARA